MVRRRSGRGRSTDIVAGVLVLIALLGIIGAIYSGQQQRAALAEEGKEIRIVARQWVFEPSEIVVKKGQEVTLVITSADVSHGFMIEGLDINVVVNPGKEVKVKFVAEEEGVYEFRCSVFCGEPWPGSGLGHWMMRGTLRVIG